MTYLQTDHEADEQREVEINVAEQIVQLSQADDTPSEFEPARALALDEVNFTSPEWMASLCEVQGWLRLPAELTLDDPDRFVAALADGLGMAQDDPTMEIYGGSERPATALLDRLHERLQQAVPLQNQFQADLTVDGGTISSATAAWLAAWEDGSEAEESSGPVSAEAKIWNINDFSARASRDQLNLSPSYQRGDVWPTGDSQKLIESILRGIPLPSVIILKADAADARYEVVDGKQRLTSILRFIGKHPRALHTVRETDRTHPGHNFAELFANDYPAFRRLWKNVVGEPLTASRERELYFPFRLRSGSVPLRDALSPLQGKYYTQIKGAKVQISGGVVELADLFEQTTDYKIPLIEYSKATRKQIHEVFNLYNKQGTHLNAEEIRNALYHDVDFMRGLIVASGDIDDVATVAPFLLRDWPDLVRIQGCLDDYKVGTARYRRTKVLSWLASMLLVDSMDGDKSKRLSTAKHIDSLAERIQNDVNDPLRDPQAIRDAFRLLLIGIESHSAFRDVWAPKFRDSNSGAKWQELQLIASVLGVTIAAAVLGDELEDRLDEHASDLFSRSGSEEWKRPSKTQTASQWKYIAKVATQVVETLDVDLDVASDSLRERFGYSCVPTLRAVPAAGGV